MRILVRNRFPHFLAVLIVAVTARAASIEVVPPDFTDAQQPQVAADDDGSVYVAFGRGDEIFVAISHDQARTFAPPQKIGALTKLSLGMRRGPRIAVHGRALTVTAQAQDLFAFHSDDAGRTWSEPLRI